MQDSRYPVEMISGVPVVTAPAEIDATAADQLRAVLLQAAAHGHTTIAVDMTRTRFCDSAGLGILVRGHKRALKEGGELRLVIPAGGAVSRIFTLTTLYRFIPASAACKRPSRKGPRHPGRAAPRRRCGPVADTRACEQCGAAFVPPRQHARFCCVRCRAGWNREQAGDPAAGACALRWSVTAMTETIDRLPMVRTWDQTRALAAIAEAVWQVTLVDATLVRHHLDTCDRVLAGQTPQQRALTEQTLAGLRFVRNHIGTQARLAGFVRPGGRGIPQGPVTSWTWKPAQDPALASRAPCGQAWEAARYQAYQAHLAGHTIGETFGRAVAFLHLAAANARPITIGDAHARR